jgi:hypothetical protein
MDGTELGIELVGPKGESVGPRLVESEGAIDGLPLGFEDGSITGL